LKIKLDCEESISTVIHYHHACECDRRARRCGPEAVSSCYKRRILRRPVPARARLKARLPATGMLPSPHGARNADRTRELGSWLPLTWTRSAPPRQIRLRPALAPRTGTHGRTAPRAHITTCAHRATAKGHACRSACAGTATWRVRTCQDSVRVSRYCVPCTYPSAFCSR
jgi:hypothetical protein